jgi:kynurenine 3-monooxygenase
MRKAAKTRDVVVAGAGLAGCLLAILLAKQGHRVRIFERRGDPRKVDRSDGRSINLALAQRGISALQQAGVAEKAMRWALPMHGRMIHTQDGQTQFQRYGSKARECIHSMHRESLNQCLLDEAEQAGVEVQFHRQIAQYQAQAGMLVFDDGDAVDLSDKLLIGADGAGSMVRKGLLDGQPLAGVEWLDHGYRELTIPPKAGRFAMDAGALHIWPRGGYMLIALPNPDRSFTATLFLPHGGAPGFEQLQDASAIEQFFRQQFPDALDAMPELQQEFQDNPVGRLGTLHCRQWHDKRTVLIGDAAHAIVPFHGQGMNAGFEDCVLLARLLREESGVPERAFAAFQRQRQPDTNAIARMALENYIEMRDSVSDPRFLIRKKLEQQLEAHFPEYFIPRYSLVMFHTLPYAEVYERGLANKAVLDSIMNRYEDPLEVDPAKFGARVRALGKIHPDPARALHPVALEV